MKQVILSIAVLQDVNDGSVTFKVHGHPKLPLSLAIDALTDALGTLHEINRSNPQLNINEINNDNSDKP